ncbi:OLC1v1030886C2 [Oldenlandia corymbosa var. corymbosa]|nr:OLC1v1030886C2 [Oldenlandia corymbosa var. corymbosa]
MVSKLWRAFIDSSGFLELHFRMSQLKASSDDGDHDNTTMIVVLIQEKFYTFYWDHISNSADVKVKQLQSPLSSYEGVVNLVSSCDGLLCLTYPERDKIIVWNPWIQEHLEIPPSPLKSSDQISDPVGFALGYDHANSDYKLVNWHWFEDLADDSVSSSCCSGLCVYIFKRNSWSRTGNLPFKLYTSYYQPALCAPLDGKLHWLAREGSEVTNCIITFDLSSEKLGKLTYPTFYGNDEELSVLNGCLYINCWQRLGEGFVVQFWIMEKYGVDSTWINICSVETPYQKFCHLVPIRYSKKRKELMLQLNGSKLEVYDLDNKSASNFTISDAVRCVPCTGSLISLR